MKKTMLMMAVLALVAITGYSDGKSNSMKKAATNSEDDAVAGKEPSALTVARKAYQAQVNSALDPIKKKYLAQLEDLKKQLGGKGDLEGAGAVQREINIVGAKDVKSGKDMVSHEDNITGELIGKWEVQCIKSNYRAIWIFDEDGTVTCPSDSLRSGRWELKKNAVEITWYGSYNGVCSLTLPLVSSGTKGDSDQGTRTITAKKLGDAGNSDANGTETAGKVEDADALVTALDGKWMLTYKDKRAQRYVEIADGVAKNSDNVTGKVTRKGSAFLITYSHGWIEKWSSGKKGWKVDCYHTPVWVEKMKPEVSAVVTAVKE